MARAMAADLAAVPGCVVHSVVARTAESAAAFGRDFKARRYAALDEMLADDGVDIVYVNTPNHVHYPQVRQALEAGKPVLCEKPFTLNAAHLGELIELARAQKLFLMEAMWVRYLPAVTRLRQVLAEKAIGDLQWMQASFHSNPPKVASNRFYDLAMGGGALMDLGIYPISFASLIFGSAPQRIQSSVTLAETGVDERFAAIFDYAGAGQASVSAGFSGYFEDEIVLLGSEGKVRVPRSGGWKMNRLVIERKSEAEDLQLPVDGRGYGYQASEVVRCLEAGLLESPVMPLNESLAIMKTLDDLRAQWGVAFPGE
jgi:dihydrodiol dehydrogenase / D-xylose 1-dehydrogenase (NADP)